MGLGAAVAGCPDLAGAASVSQPGLDWEEARVMSEERRLRGEVPNTDQALGGGGRQVVVVTLLHLLLLPPADKYEPALSPGPPGELSTS